MVYISRDGKVYNKRPWSISRLFAMFIGFFTAIVLFIRSLIDPFTNPAGTTSSSTDRRSFWGGSGGGESDGRPPRPPRRPMGRITYLSDITVPGGCSGGSCGR